MKQSRLILDRQAFTANTDLLDLTAGRYIDYLSFAIKGEMTAADAKLPADLIGVLDVIQVRYLGSPVIYLTGEEVWALDDLWFGKHPITIAASAATDSQSKIMGLFVPVAQPPRPAGTLHLQVLHASVSGIDTETLTIAEISSDKTIEGKYYHIVRMPGSTAATTGYGNRVKLPQVGDLNGIMLYSATIPTNSAETATIQRVTIEVDGHKLMEREWHELYADSHTGGNQGTFASPGDATVTDNYVVLDLSNDPIPAASKVIVDIDAGVASSSFVVIPIYRV